MKKNGLMGRTLYWLSPVKRKQCRCCCLFCRWYVPCREDVEGRYMEKRMEEKDGKEEDGGT